ncbi:Ig-like domain-containing protein, partial [Klebsiella pneumoniae]
QNRITAAMRAVPMEPTVAVTGVSVSPKSASVEVKKTVQLTATVAPAGATNKKVTWASKNAEFATVDAATGLVTGVAEGTATIEVTTADGSHKATATVQVTAAAA